jgi:hypothetical protein
MSELMTIEMVDKLKNVLSCNKKNLAVLLNVTQQTLSNNIEQPWAVVKDQKFGKNLLALLYVVEALSKDKSLDAQTIHMILHTPKYMMADGNIIDVATGIKLGLSKEMLAEVADKTVTYLRKNYDKRPSSESLYFRASSL